MADNSLLAPNPKDSSVRGKRIYSSRANHCEDQAMYVTCVAPRVLAPAHDKLSSGLLSQSKELGVQVAWLGGRISTVFSTRHSTASPNKRYHHPTITEKKQHGMLQVQAAW